MSRLVFLLEEPSMKEFLNGFLPRLIPDLRYLCIPHEGKSDLEGSMRKKLRGWHEPDVHFFVVRDNDGADCAAIKERLSTICRDAFHPDTTIRVACQELEAWYLGHPDALAAAYDNSAISAALRKRKFREPDHLQSPSRELQRIVPGFKKIDAARRMGTRMTLNPATSTSHSFRVFVAGVLAAVAAMNS